MAIAIRYIPSTAIVLLVFAWWYVASLEWRSERVTDRITSYKVSADSFDRVPLSAEPQRMAVQRMLVSDNFDLTHADELLAESIQCRPLYAPYWLDRATVALAVDNKEEAKQYASRAASLWPNRPLLLWRVAMLHVRMGEDAQSSLEALSRYLSIDPGDYKATLAIAERIESDPVKMLDILVPDRLAADTDRDNVLWEVLKLAQRREDVELVQAAWRELSPDARNEAVKAASYVEWMASLNKRAEAINVWSAYRSKAHVPAVENEGFEEEMKGGLGWRTWERPGVMVSRDDELAHSGDYSLKLDFSGEENLHYSHVRQYLPVEPGASYRLVYTWRGRNISTRSGPYVAVLRRGAGHLTRNLDRWGSWDWERSEMVFSAPPEVLFVELLIRRNSTDALDNKIAGQVWFDDFALIPVVPGAKGG